MMVCLYNGEIHTHIEHKTPIITLYMKFLNDQGILEFCSYFFIFVDFCHFFYFRVHFLPNRPPEPLPSSFYAPL